MSVNTPMTFIFDFETWFKVTEHPLLKSFVNVNDEPNG